jgi:hypothetical protein
MSDDKHKIKVSLDTGAKPPVTVSPEELCLKHDGTHKVIWKPADGTTAFVFHTLAIADTTFTNPVAGGKPGKKGPLSDVCVSDNKVTLKDKVDGAVVFPYVLTVKVGDTTYSTEDPRQDGGTPKIRNQD